MTIPDSVTSIGKMAFFECDSLKSVIVPSTVSQIDERAFGYTITGNVVPVDGFVMICEKDTVAYDYAVENGFWYGTNCSFPVTRVITPERFRKKKTMATDSVRYHSSSGK